MKIHPVGAELFHADRHDKGNSRFSLFWRTRLKSVSRVCNPSCRCHLLNYLISYGFRINCIWLRVCDLIFLYSATFFSAARNTWQFTGTRRSQKHVSLFTTVPKIGSYRQVLIKVPVTNSTKIRWVSWYYVRTDGQVCRSCRARSFFATFRFQRARRHRVLCCSGRRENFMWKSDADSKLRPNSDPVECNLGTFYYWFTTVGLVTSY